MSHSVSVFMFLIASSEIPPQLASWQDASQLISERWDKWKQDRNAKDIVVSSSRNWWHQHLLYLICKEYGIDGLGFAAREITCLGTQELLAAREGLAELLELVRAHRLAAEAPIFHNYPDIVGPASSRALERARATARVEQYDDGFEAAVSFFAFVKSLGALVNTALQQERSLLFIMPTFNDVGGSFDSE